MKKNTHRSSVSLLPPALAFIGACLALPFMYWALEYQTYVLGSPAMTFGVCVVAWLGICLLFEYAVAVLAPLSVSAQTVQRGVLALLTALSGVALLCARIFWTAKTYSGTPWMKNPEIAQLCVAAFVASVMVRLVFFEASHDTKVASDAGTIQVSSWKRWLAHGAVCFALACAALYQTTPHLSGEAYNLQNDEYLQYGAAVGYNRTGQWVDWDFTKGDVQRDSVGSVIVYDRAHVSTWQMAMVMRVFGESEAVARSVAVAWFIVFIWLVYGTAFYWSRSIGIAVVLALMPIFFDGVIMHARMVRMYSPLLTISFALLLTLWKTYNAAIAGKWATTLLYGVSSFALLLFGWKHQELILIIIPGIIGFVLIEWLRFFVFGKYSDAEDRNIERVAQRYRTVFLVLLCAGALITWLVNEQLQSAIFTIGHIGVRKALNTQYEFLAFMDFALPLFVAGMYATSVVFAVFHRKSHSFERYVAVVSATVIFVMLAFVLRYKAYRYIQFLLPFVGISVWLYWYRAVHAFVGLWMTGEQRVRQWTMGAAAGVFFVVFVPLSIAGVPEMQPWLTRAQADKLSETQPVFDHHVSAAYDFVRSQKTPESVVVTMSFRDLYWKNDPSLQLITLPENNVYTIDQLNAFLATHPNQEMWFVWEQGKEHHLKPTVLKAIQSRTVDLSVCVDSLKDAHMNIYYYGQQKIDCSR